MFSYWPRNLGIPNVTVSSGVVAQLAEHDGEQVVMAVSKSGLVEISPWSDKWKKVFKDADASKGVTIKPDLEKLDLTFMTWCRLMICGQLIRAGLLVPRQRSWVSCVRIIRVMFPVVWPFLLAFSDRKYLIGLMLQVMAPYLTGWLKVMPFWPMIPMDDPEHAEKTEAFRAELYEIVINTKVSQSFKNKLRAALKEAFGSDNPPGVFVRSDTNVEDLAGFTGAGLNLTLPNVVGYDNLLNSISKVWASPFTARAFAWRQSHMTQPEHVYTSILLLESVASDKSGVLVTQDIDTGNRDVVSVAVNEGLGGAVDGQAAESLRIPLDGSSVQVLATATAPWRRVPDPKGGLTFLPSSGSDTVLQPAEIDQVIDFAKHLPDKFPAITDDEGNSAPADVEFGFVDGDLRLFQLRPFLDSKMAGGISYLQQMDAVLKNTASIKVNMNGVPEQ